MEFKANNQVFAVKRLKTSLTKRQSSKLRVIAEFLAKDLSHSKFNYKRFFELTPEDLEYIDVEHAPDKKKKDLDELVKNRPADEMSEEEEEEDWEDPINYLEIVRMALIDTRRILETLDEDGNVYNQLWEIFKMFSGNLTVDLNESWHSSMEEEEKLAVNAKENKDNARKTMHILTLSQFIRYFKISERENDFFEEAITKLAVLTSI